MIISGVNFFLFFFYSVLNGVKVTRKLLKFGFQSLKIFKICRKVVVWQKHTQKSERERRKHATFSFNGLCSWGEKEEGEEMKVGGGGQPAILPVSVFLLDSTVSPPVTTPRHCQDTGASGWARQGATQETGNHERARGSHGGERRRQPWRATAATVDLEEWQREKMEVWVASSGRLRFPITCP